MRFTKVDGQLMAAVWWEGLIRPESAMQDLCIAIFWNCVIVHNPSHCSGTMLPKLLARPYNEIFRSVLMCRCANEYLLCSL